MVDLPVSVVAWMGVVLIQAIVHYSIGSRKRQQQEEEEISFAVDEKEVIFLASRPSDNGSTAKKSSSNDMSSDWPDDRSQSETVLLEEELDGDEPENFLQLLSQTGSEMMKSAKSMENLVQEQIQQ